MALSKLPDFLLDWNADGSPPARPVLVDSDQIVVEHKVVMPAQHKIGEWIVCGFAIAEIATVNEHGGVTSAYFTSHGQPKTIGEKQKVFSLNRQRLALVNWFSALDFRLRHLPQQFPLNWDEINERLTDMFNTACEDESQSPRMQSESQKLISSVCEKIEQIRRIKVGDLTLFQS